MNPDDLESKILRMLDGELPSGELPALETELLENPEARETWQKLTRVHSALETRYSSLGVVAQTRIVPVDRIMARQRKRILEGSIAAAAAVLLISLVAMTLLWSPAPVIASFRTTPDARFQLTHATEGKDEGKAPNGNSLAEGSRLRLASGTVEATFASGVRAVLQSPCDLEVLAKDRISVSEGTAWFEVPASAVGFTIESPQLVIVDLGTTFGVSASPDDHDEIHVTQGRVEVTPRRRGTEKQTLVAGEARRVDESGRLQDIAPETGKFATRLPEISYILVKNPSFETPVVAGDSLIDVTGWSKAEPMHDSGLLRGIFSPHGDQFAWANGPDTKHGPNLLYQDLDETITEGTIYTLTVDVGQRELWPAGGATIRLYGTDKGIGTPFAETGNILPPQGDWLKDQIVTFTATAAHATGQRLGIALIASGGTQAAFDNVRVTAHTHAPPSTNSGGNSESR